jgi:hypothetical protein
MNTTSVTNAAEYRNLPLALLTESTTNPRRIFEDEPLKELAESTRSQGVILKRDYAHIVMTPRIIFTPSEGKAHRGPWRAMKTWLFQMPAGSRVTILASISAPILALTLGGKPENPSYWIIHLLSLQANANLAVAYYFDEVTGLSRWRYQVQFGASLSSQ